MEEEDPIVKDFLQKAEKVDDRLSGSAKFHNVSALTKYITQELSAKETDETCNKLLEYKIGKLKHYMNCLEQLKKEDHVQTEIKASIIALFAVAEQDGGPDELVFKFLNNRNQGGNKDMNKKDLSKLKSHWLFGYDGFELLQDMVTPPPHWNFKGFVQKIGDIGNPWNTVKPSFSLDLSTKGNSSKQSAKSEEDKRVPLTAFIYDCDVTLERDETPETNPVNPQTNENGTNNDAPTSSNHTMTVDEFIELDPEDPRAVTDMEVLTRNMMPVTRTMEPVSWNVEPVTRNVEKMNENLSEEDRELQMIKTLIYPDYKAANTENRESNNEEEDQIKKTETNKGPVQEKQIVHKEQPLQETQQKSVEKSKKLENPEINGNRSKKEVTKTSKTPEKLHESVSNGKSAQTIVMKSVEIQDKKKEAKKAPVQATQPTKPVKPSKPINPEINGNRVNKIVETTSALVKAAEKVLENVPELPAYDELVPLKKRNNNSWNIRPACEIVEPLPVTEEPIAMASNGDDHDLFRKLKFFEDKKVKNWQANVDRQKQQMIQKRMKKFAPIYAYRLRVAKSAIYIATKGSKDTDIERRILQFLFSYTLEELDSTSSFRQQEMDHEIRSLVLDPSENESDMILRGLQYLDARYAEWLSKNPKDAVCPVYKQIIAKLEKCAKELGTIMSVIGTSIDFAGYRRYL